MMIEKIRATLISLPLKSPMATSKIILSIILLLWRYVNADVCDGFFKMPNSMLKGHVIETITATEKDCRAICRRNSACNSINFIRKTSQCELNSDTHFAFPEHFIPGRAPGAYYAIVKPVTKCSNMFCSSGMTCKMREGGETYKCEDLNECETSNPCHVNATCTNTMGSYECLCKPGFNGDGFTCSDKVACSSSPCQNGGSCAEKGSGLYGCTCASGYTGANCETAVTSGVGCVLHFTTKSTSNYIQLDQPFRWFGKFSVSVWLKMDADDHIDPAMILSYATASNVEALLIGIKKDGVAEIKFAGAGALLASGFTRDNTWQHLVFYYRDGKFQVYKNNVLQEEKEVSGVASLDPAGSILVIGQHQGSLGANFDPSKLFYGYMANLNIWANVLNDFNRGKVYEQGCTGSVDGNPALSWGTITGKTLLGNIQPQCALTCP
ncbi:sushi, von Willebrand factor type A, EGF and pentraxin domain-containing protein 1 [Nematostella vectensis]|uniref:sushi, von Willebrand factor type A, EGF and pentraxin domain-containing protein 1 n=1 Tax=Nematostella vectensis TaxID=45351 RepID=UPI0020774DCF|nr:sushi, von Willebrand factor type A, EGF and pentraxin domain-containing protein 1 [Nematostella vectensis]